MSRSILKAQNEQVQLKPYSANAEDLRGGTLNEPANYSSKKTSNFYYPQKQLNFFFSVHTLICLLFIYLSVLQIILLLFDLVFNFALFI